MKKKVRIFSGENCGACNNLKAALKENNVEFTEVNVGEPEGMQLAMEFRIRSLPTTQVLESDDSVFIQVVGFSQGVVKEIKHAVNIHEHLSNKS